MAADLGFTFLFLAITVCFFQISFCLFSKIRKFNIPQTQLCCVCRNLTFLTTVFSIVPFICLVYSFAISDFSITNVYFNSHTLKPLLYKITGAWGNHEGSMLLLLVILVIYNAAFALFSPNNEIKSKILSVQSLITFGFLAFIIFTSNPFIKIYPTPDNGIGLNPILQDIGLAMHPPMLYTGYIGFSLIFSIAVGYLIHEKIDKDFVKILRPWLTFSWSFLTLGIGLGSWWAYRELGWGGYWFWDPVENVSLMPWLCATALLHSIIILQRTDNFKLWSAFLSILTFIFCLLGIFLVRSGILTSVHSFANDPSRGIFIILLFLLIGLLGFGVFFIKSLKINSKNNHFDLVSKTGFVLLNNFIFCFTLFVIILGTLYPLILQIFFDHNISVGAPYYAKILSPIAILILALMIFVPALKLQNFKKFNKETLKKLFLSVGVSFIFFLFLFKTKFQIIPFLAVFLGLITIIFAVFHLKFKNNSKQKSKEIYGYYSMFLAHIGFAFVIIAISLNALFSQTKLLNMDFNQKVKLASYEIEFKGVENSYGKNYLTRIGIFEIKDGNKIFQLKTESRYYPVADQNTSEAAIKNNLFSDLYLVLGEKNSDNNFIVRIYHKAFISFLWLGCFMMFGAGMLSLLKRILIKN